MVFAPCLVAPMSLALQVLSRKGNTECKKLNVNAKALSEVRRAVLIS
jgi:hypothetical protein